MSEVCLIDNSTHVDIDALHLYLGKFKISREKYYTEYFPKFDLLTKEPIKFKNYSQYFSQDFQTKSNLKKWLKLNPEKGWEWSINWLKKRKESKGLIYAPTHVELLSLSAPSINEYEAIGGFDKACELAGLKKRFTNQSPVFKGLPKDVIIICDTREQNPLKLPLETKSQKLDYGDYALAKPHDQKIYIERKSISDFAGTFNGRSVARKKKPDDSPFERFERELKRAMADNAYLVLLVEVSINDALSFNFLPQMRWSKVKPSHIFKNLRELLTKYPNNFQAVFADGRIDAAKKMIRVFELGQAAQGIDLQYAFEKELI